jgi:hypothetical protein
MPLTISFLIVLTLCKLSCGKDLMVDDNGKLVKE